MGIAGTPFILHYQSDRVPGRRSGYDLDVSLAPAELPSGLRNIQLEIDVAGQRLAQEFAARRLRGVLRAARDRADHGRPCA